MADKTHVVIVKEQYEDGVEVYGPFTMSEACKVQAELERFLEDADVNVEVTRCYPYEGETTKKILEHSFGL